MKVSAVKTTDQQGMLFDEPLGNHGHVRTLIGDWTEELLARLLVAKRHKTDSRCDYCPDLSDGFTYYETKAAGLSRQTFIYAGRLEKDRGFVDAGNRLSYAILHHGCRTKDYQTRETLRDGFYKSLRCLYVVPFTILEKIARHRGEKALNSAYGKHNNEACYGSGYRVPLVDLKPFRVVDLSRFDVVPL